MPTTVSRILNWYEWETGGCIVSFLKWEPSDPLSVRIEFGMPPGSQVWMISRDLLADVAEGKTTSAGIGDIVVSAVDDWMTILLRSPDGTGKFRTDMDKIGFFLKAIDAQMPRGTEEIDVDSALQKLLEGNYE